MDEEKTYWRVGLFVCLSLLAALSLWWIPAPVNWATDLGTHSVQPHRPHQTGCLGAFVWPDGQSCPRRTIVVSQRSGGAMVELTAAIKPEIFNVLSDQTRFTLPRRCSR